MTVSGLLIDLDGVVYLNGKPIPGAIEALKEIRKRGIPFRFVSNNTHRSRRSIAGRLKRFGVDVPVEWIFTPLAAVIRYLRDAGVSSCYFLGSVDAAEELRDADIDPEDTSSSFVVVGDLSDVLTYEMFVDGFRVLMKNNATLLALEHDRYFQGDDGLLLSAGAFVSALEFSSERTAFLLGKPSPEFFLRAVSSLGLSPDEVLMIGDDPRTDAAGAQSAGIRGVLVLTGKFTGVLPPDVGAPYQIIPALSDVFPLLTQ